jgi:predicted RNase H-like HicB family nuclease
MPRKRKSTEDVIKTLKELLDNYIEIIELEDKLNQEKFMVNSQLEKSIIDIKNIVSKL